MKRFVVFAMLLVAVLVSSCIKWKGINGNFVQVYKTKSDYTNNAYVLYNKDKACVYQLIKEGNLKKEFDKVK